LFGRERYREWLEQGGVGRELVFVATRI
jgi:hypothetical protein